jgi:hypothetical protein
MTTGLVSSQSARLAALQIKHRAISEQIDRENKFPSTNPLYIRQLKLMKLRLKDEIEGERRRA